MKDIKLKNIAIILSSFFLAITVFAMINNVQAANDEALIWIDSPSQNQLVEGNVQIQGWIMSNHKDAEIQILVNNVKQNTAIYRMHRLDVLNAIGGYGGVATNTRPGYQTNIDISNLPAGLHIVTIQVLSKDRSKVIEQKSVQIRVGIYNSLIWIDTPNYNKTEINSIDINGWIMTEKSGVKIESYINNIKVSNEVKMQARPDVLNAIMGYGNISTNNTPGFQIRNIDISNLKSGVHNLEIRAVANDGTIVESKTNSFIVRKADTLLNLDTPSANSRVKTEFTVQGWVLSEDKDDRVQIEFAGNTYNANRQIREDVLRVISGFGEAKTNPNPGYKMVIDTSNIKDGTHRLTIKVISKTGELLSEQSRNIVVKKYESLLNVDTPNNRQNVKREVMVQGWALSEDKDDKIEIILGGKTYTANRQTRQDVLNAVGGYGGAKTNLNPGYKETIDVTNLKDGEHTLTIRLVSSKTNEVLTQQSKVIVIKKYEGLVNIDYPSNTMLNTTSVNIQGWTMSEDNNDKVKIYIGNKLISSNPHRYNRTDVTNAVPGYGGATVNQTAGFAETINISGFSEGKHILKIVIESSLGDIIATGQKTIQIYHNVYFGIDVSVWQGNINFDSLVATGKLDFIIARAGYYSESQGRLIVDSQFERNYTQSKTRGIPLGTYIYSYATSVEGAKREANALVTYFKQTGKSFELPVFFDLEDPSQQSLSTKVRTDMCNAFGEILEANGYKVGIYASKNWLINYIDLSQIPDRYDIWAASYGVNDGLVPADRFKYEGNHDIWQYTSRGTIDGISGDVDFNIGYKKYW